MINKIKKIIIISLIVLSCSFFLAPRRASALLGVDLGNLSGGVVNNAMDAAFNKLGVNQNELKYMINTANVSRLKKQQPQVEISFTPDNPVTAQKVTAVATPSYFMNSMENLYFTWYLKPKGCPDSGTSPSRCDFDGDGHININDYKVNAARILASNDFEWNKADYSSGTGGKAYTASWGGNDQNGKTEHCFVHDVNSGNEYEINCDEHLFPQAYINGGFKEMGKGNFRDTDNGLRYFAKFFHTNPNSPDTAGTGNGDEANVVGMGMNTFSWTYEKGDQVGVVVEGVSDEPTQYTDSSYKTMWALVNNDCGVGSTNPTYPKTTNIITGTEPANIGTGATSPASDPINYCNGDINGIRKTTQISETTEYDNVGQAGDNITIRTKIYETDTTDNNCDGIFGNDSDTSVTTPKTITCSDGDTSYIDPEGYQCNGLDETTSLTASDLSLSITKASDLNDCLEDNYADPAQGGGAKTKMDISLAYSPDFPMNDDNGSTYNKDGDGDQLTVQSTIANADNPGYLKYAWQLWENDSPNPINGWGDEIDKGRLPDNFQKTGIGLDSLKLRLNIPDLNKYLKVKLTVTENSSGEIRTGHSEVVIPVSKITQSQRIQAYGTNVSNILALSPKNNDPKNDELCLDSNKKPEVVCYVAKNEIISLLPGDKNLSDVLWTVNGNPIVPIQANSGTTAYLPILEDNGYRYSAEMTATNSDGDKLDLIKTFEVADPEVNIISADTSVCKPDLLGNYVDLDGKYWPDYSKTSFSAITGGTIKLQAQFNGIAPTPDQYSWNVDGYSINKTSAPDFQYSVDDKGILSLKEKPIGESYGVSVGGIYSQDNNTKKALSKYWGVTMDKFYEKKIASAIQVTFVGSISDTQGASKDNLPKKIMASMYSATPAYIAFLLRIVLTAFAMLIFSKIILSFSPNLKENEY